jgi:hypothetical protein
MANRGGGAVDEPDTVHHESEPHMRSTRLTAAHLIAAVALSGALVATGSLPASAARPASVATAQAAAVSAVPAAALLQPADLNGAATTEVTDDYWAALRPPQPCGPYRSAGLRRSERAVQAMVGVGDRPTVILNDVATYRSGGAHRYLRDLRRAVTACRGEWKVLRTGVAGDESLLLRRREHLEYAGTTKDTYVVVARTGRALVVVADTGWETASGHKNLVRRLSVVAVRRAAVVRGR